VTASLSGEDSPRWAWFAHHQIALVVVAIVIGAGAAITGNVIAEYVGSAFLLAFTVGTVATVRHTGIVCARCLDDLPTDAAVLVKRRDWVLRFHHWLMDHPVWTIGSLAAVIAVCHLLLPNGGNVFIVWPLLGFQAWARRFHGRVAPWCPYCRGDDGGAPASTPRPVPTGTKQSR
jgi:hypothetical protein